MGGAGEDSRGVEGDQNNSLFKETTRMVVPDPSNSTKEALRESLAFMVRPGMENDA